MCRKYFILFMFILPELNTQNMPELDTNISSELNNIAEEIRIIGGYEAKKQTHAKYTVSIADLNYFNPFNKNQFGQGHICGGSIIGQRTILTAAHCVNKKRTRDVIIIAGTPKRKRKDKSTQILHVARIISHPHYKDDNNDSPHDIAILHLRESLRENNVTVQRIQLAPKSYVKPGHKCLHVGWGYLGQSKTLANALKYVNLVILDPKVCNEGLKMIEKTFCAGDPLGKMRGACEGDSGGPFFCNGRLAGVENSVVKCDQLLHTFFTDVSEYLEWIKKNSADKKRQKSAAAPANIICLKIMLIFIWSNVWQLLQNF